MLPPGLLDGIDVEPCTLAEVPVLAIARQLRFAGAGVGHDENQAKLCSDSLGAGLDGEGFLGAGESGKTVHRGQSPLASGRRDVDRETHRPRAAGRVMLVEALNPAKAGVLGSRVQ